MQRFSGALLLFGATVLPLLFAFGYAASGAVKNDAAKAPASIPGGTLLKSDFNTGSPVWAGAKAMPASAKVALKPVGTVDKPGTSEASGAYLLTGTGKTSATLVSGLLPVRTGETNLGKITLAFQLSASTNQPVTVRVSSFDAAKKRTGGLVGKIYPAAPDFYQRYALDLSTLKSDGAGKFVPTCASVQFAFEMEGTNGKKQELRVDNVHYAIPAYYVSLKGSDTGDGRTEATAFATPQKALDTAQAGDIIVLMEGTYRAGQVPIASFPRPGLPDGWIVLKNYPGHHPTLTSTGWNIASISQGSREKYSKEPPLAYLELRGLHIRGEGDVVRQKYAEAIDQVDSRTNTNGIAIDCRYSTSVFHDIRIADNLVEYCTANGIGGDADRLTIENNICRSNSWTTVYAASGISVSGASNFDSVPNIYKRLIRNNVCYNNQTYQKWKDLDVYSDGNGIILDVNQGDDTHGAKVARPPENYIGRTLVQSNLCYNNGGSGIHTVIADHVDIVNNTVYMNSASIHLEYSEIFTYGSKDVRIINNILVAPVADVAAGEKPEPVNKIGGDNKNVIFSHNIYYGGNIAPTMGDGDRIGKPEFVKPAIDGKTADFHLRPGSPAVGKGVSKPFAPFRDLDGKPRSSPPSLGAYEK